CRELERIAGMGFRAALIRPIDARGRYPNFIFPSFTGGTPTATMDRVFRAFEETGLVLGMHTFPSHNPELGIASRLPTPPANMMSPGELIGRAGEMHTGGRMVDIQTLSFVFEAVTWLGQVLLSGMLDLYPKLRMAIFESSARRGSLAVRSSPSGRARRRTRAPTASRASSSRSSTPGS